MDVHLKEHMCATVNLRQMSLQRAELTRTIHQSLVRIAQHGGHEKLPELIKQQGEAHAKVLEELAEANYQKRLLYYALCLMECDHTLTADDAIADAETLVLESVIAS